MSIPGPSARNGTPPAYTSKFAPFNSGLTSNFAPAFTEFLPNKPMASPMEMAVGGANFAAQGFNSSGGFGGGKGPFVESQYSPSAVPTSFGAYPGGGVNNLQGNWLPASTVMISPFQFYYSGVQPTSGASVSLGPASYAAIM